MCEVSTNKALVQSQDKSDEILRLKDIDRDTGQGGTVAVYSFLRDGVVLTSREDSSLLQSNKTKQLRSIRSSSPEPNAGDNEAENFKSLSSESTTLATSSVTDKNISLAESVNIKYADLIADSLMELHINCINASNDTICLRSSAPVKSDSLTTPYPPTSLTISADKDKIQSRTFTFDARDSTKNKDSSGRSPFSVCIKSYTEAESIVLFTRMASLFNRQEAISKRLSILSTILGCNTAESPQLGPLDGSHAENRSDLMWSDTSSPLASDECEARPSTETTLLLNTHTPRECNLKVPTLIESPDIAAHEVALELVSTLRDSFSRENSPMMQCSFVPRMESDTHDAFEMTMAPIAALSCCTPLHRGPSQRSDSAKTIFPSSFFPYPNSSYSFRLSGSGFLSPGKTRRTRSAPPSVSSFSDKEANDLLIEKDALPEASGGIKVPAIDCKRDWLDELGFISCDTSKDLEKTPHGNSFIRDFQRQCVRYKLDSANRALSSTSVVVSSLTCVPSIERVSCVTSALLSVPPSARGFLRSTSSIVSATVTPRSHSNSQSLRLSCLAHVSPRFSPGLVGNEAERVKGPQRAAPPASTSPEVAHSPSPSPMLEEAVGSPPATAPSQAQGLSHDPGAYNCSSEALPGKWSGAAAASVCEPGPHSNGSEPGGEGQGQRQQLDPTSPPPRAQPEKGACFSSFFRDGEVRAVDSSEEPPVLPPVPVQGPVERFSLQMRVMRRPPVAPRSPGERAAAPSPSPPLSSSTLLGDDCESPVDSDPEAVSGAVSSQYEVLHQLEHFPPGWRDLATPFTATALSDAAAPAHAARAFDRGHEDGLSEDSRGGGEVSPGRQSSARRTSPLRFSSSSSSSSSARSSSPSVGEPTVAPNRALGWVPNGPGGRGTRGRPFVRLNPPLAPRRGSSSVSFAEALPRGVSENSSAIFPAALGVAGEASSTGGCGVWCVADRLAELERFQVCNQEALLSSRSKYSSKSNGRIRPNSCSVIRTRAPVEDGTSEFAASAFERRCFETHQDPAPEGTFRRLVHEEQKLK